MKSILSWLALAAAATAQHEDNAVLKALQIQPDLTKLFAALQLLPDLASTLQVASDITIFAPTDTAFETLGADTSDPDATTALLSYHVVQGQYPASAIPRSPAYVQTLLTPENHVMGSPAANVTGGQYVGVVNNGTGVQVLSGDLAVSNVVEAVCPIVASCRPRSLPDTPY